MKKYYGIDWLRAIACIGIMAMHMIANNQYEIDGFVYRRMIPSFTDFVFLFMAISAFGMSCGYYEKAMTGKINWTDFYKKRYGKIVPFFLFLIMIEVAKDFSVRALCEGFSEMTLLHGFIPDSFTVIGVGWFLGVVFIFYLIFPFYCVLIENKRRAWCAFLCAVVLNYICEAFFGLGRENFLYSLCYFLAGGLVYLYKDKLMKVKWFVYLPVIALAVGLYYLYGSNTITCLLAAISLLSAAVSIRCRKVGVIAVLSGISMEFYLSHMAVFRVIEKLRLNQMWGNGWGQYLITVSLVFVGTVLLSLCFQNLTKKTVLLNA